MLNRVEGFTEVCVNAVLAGGDRKDALSIERRLREQGADINVRWHWTRLSTQLRIPLSCDLVLFHRDFSCHSAFYSLRASARRAGIPLVTVGRDWSKSRIDLSGLTRKTPPDLLSVSPPCGDVAFSRALGRPRPPEADANHRLLDELCPATVSLAMKAPIEAKEAPVVERADDGTLRALAGDALRDHPEWDDSKVASDLAAVAGHPVEASLVASVRAANPPSGKEPKSAPMKKPKVATVKKSSIATMAEVMALPAGIEVRLADLTRWIHYKAVKAGLIEHSGKAGMWVRTAVGHGAPATPDEPGKSALALDELEAKVRRGEPVAIVDAEARPRADLLLGLGLTPEPIEVVVDEPPPVRVRRPPVDAGILLDAPPPRVPPLTSGPEAPATRWTTPAEPVQPADEAVWEVRITGDLMKAVASVDLKQKLDFAGAEALCERLAREFASAMDEMPQYVVPEGDIMLRRIREVVGSLPVVACAFRATPSLGEWRVTHGFRVDHVVLVPRREALVLRVTRSGS